MINLIDLPFQKKALQGFLSEETVDFHYNKHHKGYVDKLNDLIKGTQFEDQQLDFIVKNSGGDIFNNASQVWNHNFYWHSIAQKTEAIGKFASIDLGNIKKDFIEAAKGHFGSGYCWLVVNNGKIVTMTTLNSYTPMQEQVHPLLCCDLWEHSYYIDYRNKKDQYLEKFWQFIDWNFVSLLYDLVV